MDKCNNTVSATTQAIPLRPLQTPRRARGLWTALLAAGLLSASMTGFAADHAVDHATGGAQHGASVHTGPYAPLDDAHLQQIVHHLYDRVGTPQQAQIADIAKVAKIDLHTFEQQARQVRARRIQLLLRDVVDRGALEQMRVEEMQVADQHSKRVDRLLVDLVGVMTPQQRAQLNEHVQASAN